MFMEYTPALIASNKRNKYEYTMKQDETIQFLVTAQGYCIRTVHSARSQYLRNFIVNVAHAVRNLDNWLLRRLVTCASYSSSFLLWFPGGRRKKILTH